MARCEQTLILEFTPDQHEMVRHQTEKNRPACSDTPGEITGGTEC